MTSSSGTSGSAGASKFRITSQTQLKTKLTDAYLRSKIQKEGVRWKTKDRKFEYVKPPDLKKKFIGLYNKRKYISEETLKKDLLKEGVRQSDRERIIKTLAQKYSTAKPTGMTKEQIKGNVRMSNMMTRIMKKAADKIRDRRDVKKIKEEFKTDYSRLDVHGQKYSIGVASRSLSTDDPRYQKDKQADASQTSVIPTKNVKPVTGQTKEISSGKSKEPSLASGIGVKDLSAEDGKNKKNAKNETKIKKGENVISFLQARLQTEKDKKAEQENGNRGAYNSTRNTIIDPEFQTGVLLGGKKVIHVDNNNQKKEIDNSSGQTIVNGAEQEEKGGDEDMEKAA